MALPVVPGSELGSPSIKSQGKNRHVKNPLRGEDNFFRALTQHIMSQSLGWADNASLSLFPRFRQSRLTSLSFLYTFFCLLQISCFFFHNRSFFLHYRRLRVFGGLLLTWKVRNHNWGQQGLTAILPDLCWSLWSKNFLLTLVIKGTKWPVFQSYEAVQLSMNHIITWFAGNCHKGNPQFEYPGSLCLSPTAGVCRTQTFVKSL